jgi:hypothetical protein
VNRLWLDAVLALCGYARITADGDRQICGPVANYAERLGQKTGAAPTS